MEIMKHMVINCATPEMIEALPPPCCFEVSLNCDDFLNTRHA